MELEELIKGRRAIFPKQMNGELVPQSVVEKILELANWAPTHRNTEPWRFKVFSGNSMNLLLDLCKESYIKSTPAAKFKSIKLEKIDQRKEKVSHIVAICMKRNEIIPNTCLCDGL